MVQVYFDEKTRDLLSKIKISQPNFNLSRFLRISLEQYYDKNNSEEDDLNNQLKTIQAEKEHAVKKEQEVSDKMYKKRMAKIKEAEEQERQREIQAAKDKEIKKNFITYAKEIMKLNEEQINQLLDIFMRKRLEGEPVGIISFLRSNEIENPS